MKKRILSLLLALTLLIGMVPTIAIEAAALSQSAYAPYASIEYNYSESVECGTIRYISQVTSDSYFYWNYWPSSAFGGYSTPSVECGTASISMALSYIGINKTPYDILKAHNGYTYFDECVEATHLSLSPSDLASAMNNYINGAGKYSPPVIHLPGYSSAGHFVVVVGRISDTVYEILDPWERAVTEVTINETTVSYTKRSGMVTDTIDRLHQWYNPNVSGTYLSKCTPYPCYGKLMVTAESKYLKSLPCSAETDANSVNVGSEPVVKGDELTAIGLYMNDKGNLWYKAISDQGEGYIFADNVTYTPDLDWDFAIRGVEAPTVHQKGSVFYIKGKVSTMYQRLVNVGAWVEDAYGATKTGTILDVDTNFYDFDGSDVDKEVRFNNLPVGNYTYYIGATVRSYYAKSAKEYGVKEKDHYFSYPFVVRESVVVEDVLEATLNLLYYNEGSYGSVNRDDNGAVSIGKIQWHGNRALNLLKAIVNRDKSLAESILGTALYNEIVNSSDWSSRTVTEAEANQLSNLLTTEHGMAAQDEQAANDVSIYINHGKNLGITDMVALIYFSDLENQGGYGMSSRVAKSAAATAGSYSAISLTDLHNAALADSVAGKYPTRRNRTYNYCLNYTNAIPGYTITLDANGGSCTTSSMTVAEGTMVGTLPTPTREGYEFLGWYENNFAGCDPVTSDTIVTGNATYYAHWQSSPAGRTKITFDTNGGLLPSCYAAVPINGFDRFRDTAELIVYTADNMVNRHNEFGVSIAVDRNGRIVDKREYGDSRDITIPTGGFVIGVHVDATSFHDIAGLSVGEYIAYDKNSHLIYLYDSQNGWLAERKYMTPEDSYYALPIPSKYGYVFDGWYTASGEYISWSDYLSDTTLYAYWVEDTIAEPSYVLDAENGHRYERYDYSMSWENAKAFCESRGGHLVTFGSAEEQNDLFNVGFFNSVPYGQYFIGASDAQEEGTWRWVNDEEFSYSSWNQSIPEPNNASGNEHYVVMVTGEWVSGYAIGEWLDVSNLNHNGVHSTYATGFICEYDTIEYCTIFFDVNGGTYEIEPQIVKCGYAAELQMDVPYRFGYTFQGWSTSSAAETVDYRPGDIVTLTEDLYLYAVWQEPSVLQTPEQSASLYVENIYGFAGAATHYQLHCTESGSYLFRGMEQSGGCDNWICLYDADGNYLAYDDNGGYNQQFRLTYYLTEGETYYVSVGGMNGDAKPFNFSIAHGAYITYDANGGENAPESHWIYWDDIYPYLSGEEPTRKGYEFLGWSTNPNATHPEYDWQNDQYTANVDVTLYAVWANGLVATPSEEEINPGENMYIILDYYGDEGWEDWDWEAIMNLISGVYIDDQPVDSEYYFFEEGPFVVWVENEALAGLAEGEYTMRLETSLGNAEFRFRISYEDEVTASGTLDNISWEIRNDILIFSGTGAMPDFPEEEMERPWNGYNYYGVEIRDGITYVGAHTLKYREWVLSLTMADSVTEIGEGAFANQMRMKDVKFSENLTVIGEKAFCCSGVGNIVLPDKVTTIGAQAFAFTSIRQISLPAALSTIGDNAFDLFFDMTDVYYDGTEADWAKVSVGTGNESLLNATFHFVNPILYGDVNGDGNVNTKDRMVLTRYLAGMTGYTADMIDMEAADVNCDGTVNAKDRMILTRYLAQWTAYSELPYLS